MTSNTTQHSATIVGRIIKILEENKLTIAQSKQVLIDVDNALNSQKVHCAIQGSTAPEYTPQTLGIVDCQTIGIASQSIGIGGQSIG